MRWDWSDLRHFLGVARAGSTLGAAKASGCNQTTVARRIAALEEALGLALFDRSAAGYALTEDGRALLPLAEAVAGSAEAFGTAAGTRARSGAGAIRISSTDSFASIVIAPAIAALHRTHPTIRVEVDVTGRVADIASGEADMALRAGARPADESLIVRRIGHSAWAVYCAADYAEPPTDPMSFARQPVASLDGPPLAALRASGLAVDIVHVSNTESALVATVRAGHCVAALPCMAGDAAGLRRCFDLPDGGAPLWLVYHERLRGRPHARAFLDALLAQIEAVGPQLSGSV